MRIAIAVFSLLFASTSNADEPQNRAEHRQPAADELLVKQRIQVGKLPKGMKGESLHDKLDAVAHEKKEGGGQLGGLRASVEALPAGVKEVATEAKSELQCSYYREGSCDSDSKQCVVCCAADGSKKPRCACQPC